MQRIPGTRSSQNFEGSSLEQLHGHVPTPNLKFFDALDEKFVVSEAEASESGSESMDDGELSRKLRRAEASTSKWQPPWATSGPLAYVLSSTRVSPPLGVTAFSLTRPNLVAVPKAKPSVPVDSDRVIESGSGRRRRRVKRQKLVRKDLTMLRDEAIGKWVSIVRAVGVGHLENAGWWEHDPVETAKILFEGRATATIVKRGSDFSALVSFTLASPEGWPPSPEMVLNWMRGFKEHGTRAQSIVQAINFATYVLGFLNLQGIPKSLLIQGVMKRGLASLGHRKQSPEISLTLLYSFQRVPQGADFQFGVDAFMLFAFAFFVMAIAFRFRYFDCCSALGVYRRDEQYVLVVEATKTANLRNDRLPIVIVGPTRLTLVEDHVVVYDNYRLQMGLDSIFRESEAACYADPIRWPLFPARDDGELLAVPATLATVNRQLKLCAQALGDSEAGRYTFTSCRSSLVSAAYMISAETKAKLLNHRLSKEPKSTRAYDRCRQVGPVRKLQAFLDHVRPIPETESWDIEADMDNVSLLAEEEDLEAAARDDEESYNALLKDAEVSGSEDEELELDWADQGDVPHHELVAVHKDWNVDLIPRPNAGQAKWINMLTSAVHLDRILTPDTSICGLHLLDDKYRLFVEGVDDLNHFSCCRKC